MASIDLNIVDRGTHGSEWTAENTGLTAAHLDEVLEQKTDNASALNSLPTPFARFFVAREAFRRAMEEHTNAKKEAGFAYRQIVSDILDVFELLFNLKYHRNNTWTRGEKLEIREWKCQENLSYLKSKMPILHNSLDEYYKTDIQENSLYFIIFTEDGKDLLLATSSPFTGFVTPPDMDKHYLKDNNVSKIEHTGERYTNLHIRRKSGGEYFRDILMFENRSQDFKNYMYNILFSSDEVDDRYKFFKEYVRSFKDDSEIRNDYEIKTTDVLTDQNDSLVINGLSIKSSDEIDIANFFTPTLLKVPYRIARNRFKTVVYQNDTPERTYDYLLPFKPEVLSLFNGTDIDSDIHINRSSVTVNLRYNGKTYSKEYAEEPIGISNGKIINLESEKINLDLGIFPNILSYKEQENNYFKIFAIAANEAPDETVFCIDHLNLSFFKKDSDNKCNLIKEMNPDSGAEFGVLPAVVRSKQTPNQSESGTKLYELFNSSFDVVEVDINGQTGILIPKWETSQATNDTYTYSIDLGTSNTFMSRCKNGQDLKPEMFNMLRPMVSYLHEVPEDQQISLCKRIESSLFTKAQNKVRTEFAPVMIDGKNYRFPIRTALCGVTSNVDDAKLFDNHNIAFFYEKLMSDESQKIETDIKWEKNESMLRVFIQELLLIIKCDILQRNGDLSRTHLVWFRPLSFMGGIRNLYKKIWEQEPKNILFIQPSQTDCFSESEAPYYYFKKNNYIKDSDAVTVIDIGGGSTDFVYFKDNKPLMANSIHFGCDVLWENGYIDFENDRSNGIYQRYADTIRFPKRPDLEKLNEYFKLVNTTRTKDSINFWLSNADYCDIQQKMSDDFKPVFVYHLTAILFYMASMYKDNGLMAPRTLVFSGNGSKYIDNFICSEQDVLKDIIDLIFNRVFGGEHNVNIELPAERKESTCYGGLYRDPKAENVPEKIYHGDISHVYNTVADISNNFESLKAVLSAKYDVLNSLYKDVLALLKKQHIVDNECATSVYVNKAEEDMSVPLKTYFKKEIADKFDAEVELYDSIFFLPIVDRIFEMTKL